MRFDHESFKRGVDDVMLMRSLKKLWYEIDRINPWISLCFITFIGSMVALLIFIIRMGY